MYIAVVMLLTCCFISVQKFVNKRATVEDCIKRKIPVSSFYIVFQTYFAILHELSYFHR